MFRIADSIPIAEIDPFEINMSMGYYATTTYFKGVAAEYDALTTAEKEHRIRLAAKGLSCEAAGGYVTIVVPFVGLDSERRAGFFAG